MNQSIYDFKVKTIDGKEVTLNQYRDKVLLIVNVASYCGFTKQYKGLQELYTKYHEKGFEILGFPCNQFGAQEPGTNEEIKQFCSANYSVTFPLFDKIEVNGDNAHPLYKYLKTAKQGFLNSNIKWNFTKFLIDRNGTVVDRYWTKTTPDSLTTDIEKLLNE
ncbi:MAG: glutathione peroxidase [Ignavibacteria bacterium GWB2_35_12]|nr:MAG: glutathione peroxidase [Ignavibacteria bacterium GWA2_35_8]OGU38315.1 MAG: glutathione peroxidase [Ignavibacteria bacterium GWB2_35_12]OGU89605.1 MAG: glutathione peroxidase [Ignavibacteria bacterium RIFOXYA2_FULL_35_10]OGV20846.1 MAG: glutathione peroxidase [Ignavibacteria bacterium RIFOXYC2_FULL_35_21]